MYKLRILGYALSFLAGLCFSLSGIAKDKRKTILLSNGDYFFNMIANILLEAYSGSVSCLISLIRNILAINNKISYKVSIILCFIQISFGLLVNNRGIYGILIIVASVQLTLIGYIKDQNIKITKLSLLFNSFMLSIFDFHIKAPIFIFDILSIICCILWLVNNKEQESIKLKS